MGKFAELTPIKAIRAKCLECCCGSFTEVKLCGITDCALHAYRFGHRPKGNNSTLDTNEEENTEATMASDENNEVLELEAQLEKVENRIFYEEMADSNYNFTLVRELTEKKKAIENRIKELKGEQ